MTDEIKKLVLSVKEFSESYGISKPSIYNEINSGRLRARKFGDRTLISVEDAEAWFNGLPPFRKVSGEMSQGTREAIAEQLMRPKDVQH